MSFSTQQRQQTSCTSSSLCEQARVVSLLTGQARRAAWARADRTACGGADAHLDAQQLCVTWRGREALVIPATRSSRTSSRSSSPLPWRRRCPSSTPSSTTTPSPHPPVPAATTFRPAPHSGPATSARATGDHRHDHGCKRGYFDVLGLGFGRDRQQAHKIHPPSCCESQGREAGQEAARGRSEPCREARHA